MLRSLPRSRAFLRSPLILQARQTSTISTEGYDTYENYETYTPAVPLRSEEISQRQLTIQKLLSRDIPTISLSNGLEIPALGYQAHLQRDGKPKPWKELIWRGYRHIDMNSSFNRPISYLTSSFWSLVTGVTRSDLFVSAKLDSWWHHDPKASLYQTLIGMRTGYLDLWIMRWPVSWVSRDNHSEPPRTKDGKEIDYIQAWKVMEEQLEAGKVKALGISNFSKAELDLLLEHAKHKPVVHQMEITPYLQQAEFVEYNRSLGITPAATMPIGENSLDKGLLVTSLLQDPTLTAIASKYDITTRQLIVAWHLNNNIISIPYLEGTAHAYEILKADSIILDPEDLAAIADLERGQRLYKPKLLGYYPFSDLTDPDLMLEGPELPTLSEVHRRRAKKAEEAKRRRVEQELMTDESFGTTTYAGTVFGWVRSVDGSRWAGDNKTGHFGTALRPPKKR